MKLENVRGLVWMTIVLPGAIVLMFLPYLPGRYDGLACDVSYLMHVLSYSSLLLVPVGVLWVANGRVGISSVVGKLLMGSVGLICLLMAVSAAARGSLVLGALLIAVSYYFLLKVDAWMRGQPGSSFPIAVFLVLFPIVLFVARSLFLERAAEYSRAIAIRNSESLIRDIESYRKREGHYPISIQSLHNDSDYPPGVIGIRQYYYEPNGEAYNLYFEQLSTGLDMQEIVMFNKLDEHHFASHARDILEYTDAELALRRGDRRKINLETPHWVMIEFD